MSTENCYVDFWENSWDNGSAPDGGYHRYNGPVDNPDMSSDYWDGYNHNFSNEIDGSASSLRTGSKGWLKAFKGNNYDGDCLIVNPNTTIEDLDDYSFSNKINSFQLFDALPVDTKKVENNFLALYPGSVEVSKLAGNCIEFYAQDSHYRIYHPTIVQDSSTVNFTLNIDHDRGGGIDDHAVVTFSMDTSGKFLSKISITYDMSSGAYHVPDWAINFITDGIDDLAEEAIVYLDGAEIVFTAGLGTELVIPTDILILAGAEVLTIAVNHINDVIDKLFGLSDDGGTMYYSSIVSHAVARLVYAYYQEIYEADSGTLITFDESKFRAPFNASWVNDKHNPYFNFSNGSGEYRSYFPDNTAGYSKAGMISSVKIDAINDNGKDDHLIMLTTFDPTGKLFSVQGSIDVYGAPDTGSSDDYVAPSSGTIAYNDQGQVVHITKTDSTVLNYSNVEDAFEDRMQSALDNCDGLDASKFSDSLKGIVPATMRVLDATKAAIS